jgi:acetyltransferase-like isoleucine patch superfamily enzyme
MPAGRNLRRLPWEARYVYGQRLMTLGRRLLLQVTHRHCRLEFQGPVRLGPGFQLNIPDGGTFIVGPGVDFRRGFACEIDGDGRVEIGAGSTFTSYGLIHCATSIEIGKGCVFGQSTLIVDGYHRYDDPDIHWMAQGYDYRPLTIGDGVGVSDKCTIQASIGERAMIASQSVVNRDIPAYSLAVGAPARVVKRFGPENSAEGNEGDEPRPATGQRA